MKTDADGDEPGRPAQPACGVEYTRPGGRQPGDRIVRCDLTRGHDGDHEETDTGSTWPGCTCDLVDVSRFNSGKPEYVLGDPEGCPIHERQAEVDARAEARHQARYGAQPTTEES